MTNHTICIKCITFNHAPYYVGDMTVPCHHRRKKGHTKHVSMEF